MDLILLPAGCWLCSPSIVILLPMYWLNRVYPPGHSPLLKLFTVLCCFLQTPELLAQDLQLLELFPESPLYCLVGAGQEPRLADEAGNVLDFETENVRLQGAINKKSSQIKALNRKRLALKRAGFSQKLIARVAKQLATARAALLELRLLIDAVAECQSGEIDPVPVCGNAFVEAGESCDDGNESNGDCCSAICSLELPGSPCSGTAGECSAPRCNNQGQCVQTNLDLLCNDGNVCTINDFCSGGVCGGTPVSPNVPLSCGIGACARTVFICPDDLSTACNPGTPSAELCNSVDDNCDGVVDGAPASANCPALANAAVACQTGACVLASCNGENYDVDGILSNGCEQADDIPVVGHTPATAKFLGSFSCVDDNSQVNVSAKLPSDFRLHIPAVPGLDGTSGAAPDFFRVTATGGAFCVNDFVGSITTSGGADFACYRLTVTSNTSSFNLTVDGSAQRSFDTGSGFYNDDTDILIKVEKVCGIGIQEPISYTLNFHL